ncbi:hypothetical protein [uncultured Megasphaera sp.]|uniref:hypothetical protein n=1 Tax=uncultured Megasphaera sp. TaxID=165188 RepID=UPI0025CD5191|nr:hypothetical protein [uncultured Megasphaera sp.]
MTWAIFFYVPLSIALMDESGVVSDAGEFFRRDFQKKTDRIDQLCFVRRLYR